MNSFFRATDHPLPGFLRFEVIELREIVCYDSIMINFERNSDFYG